MDIKTLKDFKGKKCDQPGCNCGGPLYLHAKCHPEADVSVCYLDEYQAIHVECGDCGKTVAMVKVADE